MAHWRVRKAKHDQMKEDAGWVLKNAPRGIAGPVTVKFTVFMGHQNHDAGNRDSKYVIDTMVKLGIIPGDNAGTVREVSHRIELSPSHTKREYTLLQVIRDVGIK